MANFKTRVRLCMKDLYHQDVVEMIERETRKYQLWNIENPDDPDFPLAYQLLWDQFGPSDEMEPEVAIRSFLKDDQFEPMPSGTFIRYFLLTAKDQDGNLRGVRDGSVLINPAYAPDVCMVYLAHIYMLPPARGTVLSYWLRIAPVEVALQYMVDLNARGKLALPQPDAPAKHFGMRVVLTAEMEFFAPEDRLSLQRILFYGRGGFDVINPRHFPYRQPDFRPADVIAETGHHPLPFMLLLRRMGRERQATLPIDEAAALMKLLYDDFASFCSPDLLGDSLQHVLDRLAERATRKNFVELLPLPTGAKDLKRLSPLSRFNAYSKYYPNDAETQKYFAQSRVRETAAQNPKWFEDELAKIAVELEARPQGLVYGNRDKGFSWEGAPIPPEAQDRTPSADEDKEREVTAEVPKSAV